MQPDAPAARASGSRTVIGAFAARRAARSGAAWGAILSLSIASTATGYNASFPTDRSRAKLVESFANNRGVAALLGPAHDVGNVAGFTAWRITVILSMLGALWGLFAATRLMRGEEDAGRWEILLCGNTTRGSAAAQAIAGLGVGWLALWGVTSAAAVGIGQLNDVGFSPTASVFLATTVCSSASVFLAIGALTSQLAATKRQANMIGALAIGAAYLLRMVADSTSGMRWARWLSPIGWAEEMHPLTASRPAVLVLTASAVAVLVAVTVRLAGARDLGASALPSQDVREPRTALLGTEAGLTARLTMPTFIGWLIGLTICGLVFGLVAQSGADVLSGSTTIEDALARIGGRAGGAVAYLGITFLVAAVLVAVAAAGMVSAARSEEDEGHLDHLLVRPVSRARWFASRVAISSGAVLVVSAAVGIAAWIGAASQGTDVGFGELLKAGVNIAPPALVVIGFGALALGVAPRRTAAVTYAVVTWSALVELIGSIVTTNDLVLDTSVFHHTGPAPASPVNWTSITALVAVAAVAAAIGLAAFQRRDVAGA